MHPPTTVAVTGATGFLGSHIVEALQARGAAVIGVVRDPAKGGWLGPIDLRRADLASERDLAAAFEGSHAVVANAALSPGRTGFDHAAFERANVGGTENTLRAAHRAGVRRVVLVSTVAVYRTRPLRTVDEDGERRQAGRWDWNALTTQPGYSVTKARAEERAWALARELDLDLTTVRPGPIYGPRDGKLTARYQRAMTRRIHLVTTARVPHVHAGDVAAGICAALERPASIGRAYNLTGPSVSQFEVLSTWRRLQGTGPVLVPVPVPVWIDFDDGRAERELGVRFRSIARGLADTLPRLTSSAG